MLDFLQEYGISKQTINTITKNYPESVLYDLSNNEEDCIKILDYLKQIGINNYEELLILKIDIFLDTFSTFIQTISKTNIQQLVNIVNNDPTSIETLYEQMI